MVDKMMYIPNDVIQDCLFCRLQLVVETMNNQLNKTTNQNSIKSPKLLSQRKRKRYHKTLGTKVINSPMFPFFLMIMRTLFF